MKNKKEKVEEEKGCGKIEGNLMCGHKPPMIVNGSETQKEIDYKMSKLKNWLCKNCKKPKNHMVDVKPNEIIHRVLGCGKDACGVTTIDRCGDKDIDITPCGVMCPYHKVIHYCDECEKPKNHMTDKELYENTLGKSWDKKPKNHSPDDLSRKSVNPDKGKIAQGTPEVLGSRSIFSSGTFNLSKCIWVKDGKLYAIHYKDAKKFIEKLESYKKKIKKFELDKPGGTFKGYREVIEIPLEDFYNLVGEELL